MHDTVPSFHPVVMVLVVEDEPLVRMAAVEMVKDAGFETMEAASAPAALHMLERWAADLSAAFTDVDMPGGMDGLELAATVRVCWPWIALLVTSGHRAAADAALPEHAVFMPKPYREGDVVAELRRLTDDPGLQATASVRPASCNRPALRD